MIVLSISTTLLFNIYLANFLAKMSVVCTILLVFAFVVLNVTLELIVVHSEFLS